MLKWYYSIRLSKNKSRVICNIPPILTTLQQVREMNTNAIPYGRNTESEAWEDYLKAVEKCKNELIELKEKRNKFFDNKIKEFEKIINNSKEK